MKVLTAAVLTIFLVLVTLMPLNAVFAASYEELWYVYNLDDPQKPPKHWADLQVKYTFPDKVKVGTKFDVQVSITYLRNDNAKVQWLEFFGVSVHTRTSPNGTNITDSAVDSSRLRIAPTEQYSRLLTILAPNKPGEYLVVLTWKTLHPETAAYGVRMYSNEIYYDTGRGTLPPLTVVAEASLTVRLQNVKAAEIKIDGQVRRTDGGEVKVTLPLDVSHTVEMPKEIELAPGTRALFDRWSDGDTSNPRQLTLADDVVLTAIYKIQYLLTVNSESGDPQGSGWYDAGATATFSVTSSISESGFMGTLGTRIVFDRWSGDSSGSTSTATIKMDGPKSVTAIWKTDYTQAYMILGAIGAIVVLALLGVVVVMRRRAAPPPTPPVPPAAAAQKYCVQCGSPMPLKALHCPRCGEKQ